MVSNVDFDYSKYKKQTVAKIVLICIAIAAPLIAELALIPEYIKTFDNDVYIARILASLLVVFVEIICILKLSCYVRIMTSRSWAEKYYIKNHDERLQLIDKKANTLTTLVSLYIIGFSAAFAGCYDPKVFFTLLAVFFGIVIIYALSYLYYSKKI